MAFALVLLATVAAAAAAFAPQLAQVTGSTALRSHGNSTLYTLTVAGTTYVEPIYLLDLHGASRYDQGYSYGVLLGAEIAEIYNEFFTHLLGNSSYTPEIVAVIGLALDWQWRDFLSKELPQDYMEELRGLGDGGATVGAPKAGAMAQRMIVLANAPGDLKDFILVLLREFDPSYNPPNDLRKTEPFRGMCSMMAAWGSRTEAGKLFSGRNLDWQKDTGINKYKLVTVHHPPAPAIEHATFGFVGLFGSLAGISALGLSAHEANLEEEEITFGGFPWLLRLRYIMENARNSKDARALWAATNNTVGFNHMITSAPDAAAFNAGDYNGPGVATVFETMFNYTAYFADNDPREQAAKYPANNAPGAVQIGFPLPDALWRTNNGFDPVIRANYKWSQAPGSDTQQRYVRVHDTLLMYAARGPGAIDLAAMANLTAVLGSKGDPYDCSNVAAGSNILSVAFGASDRVVAAAWESNHGSAWRPAACSTYAIIDLNQWFLF